MSLVMLGKTIFPFILHKGYLQTVYDENGLLYMLFLLQATHRFLLAVNIGRWFVRFGSKLLALFRFISQLWGNVNLWVTNDTIIFQQ